MTQERMELLVPHVFFKQVVRLKDRVALRYKEYGIWQRISWKEYGQKVTEVAAGLIGLGLSPGQYVAILGDNVPEWFICHLGIMIAGGATCGVYPTLAPEGVAYELNHSESKILFAENEEQVDKVLQILPEVDLKQVVVWDPRGLWGFSHPKIIFFDQFLEKGRTYLQANPDCVKERIDSIKSEDTALIIYTSGTTGPPKGAMVSHGNIKALIESLNAHIPAYETDELISYLPLAHVLENVFSVFRSVWSGATVNFVENLDTLAQDLKEVSPTFLAGVPRIWEKFASMVEIRMSDSTLLKRALYRLSFFVGSRYIRAKNDSTKRYVHVLWGIFYWFLYWTVLYHLKKQLGFERVRIICCGGAPASTELFEYYNALGIPLREGYGQTESTGVISQSTLDLARWGFVGKPLPNVEVKIAEDGEILARGPTVFKGYYKDPELTASTLEGGWLHTGDVGMMEDGLVKILDRKKDIIITSAGKNITPAFIENKLKFSPYIQDSVVIGDRRKYLTALILIDEDNVNKYAQDNRIPFTTFEDLTKNQTIYKLIEKEVTKVNNTLSRVETIKKFALLPRRLYVEDGDVTPTRKVKRRILEKRYADLIESFYR